MSRGSTNASINADTAASETSITTPSGWVATITADGTNGSLKVTVTGASAMNVSWVAHMRATQITG